MTRDIASSFNHQFGETFVVPEAQINEQLMTIPGTDGQKMSKSYGNTLDIFLPEKQLKKQVMSIITDSTPLEEPKNPDTCNVFKLYELMATPSETEVMRGNYTGGNYGYGHAKKALLELLIDRFKEERKKFEFLTSNPEEIETELRKGEQKAKEIALSKLEELRNKLGYH